MSQVTHPVVSLRSHRTVVLAAVLALAATVAVVLVVAIGSGASDNSGGTAVTPSVSQSGVRYDGGLEEGRAFAAPANVRYDGGLEEGTTTSGR